MARSSSYKSLHGIVAFLKRLSTILLHRKVVVFLLGLCLTLLLWLSFKKDIIAETEYNIRITAWNGRGQASDEDPASTKSTPSQPPPPSPSQTDNIPESLRRVINSTKELKGRHSDYLMPPCQDPHGLYQWKTEKIYDFVEPYTYLKNYKNPCWRDEYNQIKCVPHVYLIGVTKAGSTDLYKRMTQHPQLLRGSIKETRWFDRRRFIDERYKTFNDYVNFYHNATQEVERSVKNGTEFFHHKVIVDGSPKYFFSSHFWRQMPGNEGCSEPRVTVMSHIHHLWPKAKLIMIVRNPTSRLYSAYNYNQIETGSNRTPEEFHEWVLQSMDVWDSCLSNHSLSYCMYDGDVEWNQKLWTLHIGLYSRYILDVLKVFPREQLLIMTTEEYSENTLEWLRKIFKFLELDELSEEELAAITKLPRANKTKFKTAQARPMLNETKELLDNFYRQYNQEMAYILRDNNLIWLRS